MRAVLFAAVLGFLVGCGSSAPTTAPETKTVEQVKKPDPPKVEPKPPEKVESPKKPLDPVKKEEPPKKNEEPPKKAESPNPEVKLTLAQARPKILKLNKAETKELLGPPDDTYMGTYNGANTVVWVYKKQRVIWNEDTEKYYPYITVAFYHTVDGKDTYKAVEVKTE